MPIRQRFAVLSAMLLGLALAAPSAWAQFASTLEGTVIDPSGAVVPGATVTITNEATGVSQSGLTTTAGYYRFPALPGGMYTIKVTIQGFAKWTNEHVRLEFPLAQLLEQQRSGLVPAEVDSDHADLALRVLCNDLPPHAIELVFLSRYEDQVAILARQQMGKCLADAARRAGDQGQAA